VNTVWVDVEDKLGGWVRGQLLMMLAIGVMAGVGYLAFDLPNALILAVFAGFGEMVPMIGPLIAFGPGVGTALAIDPTKGLLVLAYAIIVQQFEAYILVPRVMRHAVGVSPFTIFVGILAGSMLYGIAGALIAVPIAGAIQVILAHVTHVEDPVQAEAHHGEPREATAPAVEPPAESKAA
jgi:predicted PurR-regulated permease PerM